MQPGRILFPYQVHKAPMSSAILGVRPPSSRETHTLNGAERGKRVRATKALPVAPAAVPALRSDSSSSSPRNKAPNNQSLLLTPATSLGSYLLLTRALGERRCWRGGRGDRDAHGALAARWARPQDTHSSSSSDPRSSAHSPRHQPTSVTEFVITTTVW